MGQLASLSDVEDATTSPFVGQSEVVHGPRVLWECAVSEFEVLGEGDASVTVRHVREGHEYDFGLVGEAGAEWRHLRLISCHESGGAFTAGLHVKAARAFALEYLKAMRAH